ncbi:MAG: cellulase family glycosylhydrolase [Chloroflexi bacterium]|nr:cellulase family glycosylhydrolase [Chloroflexota bacterium]
MRRRVASVIALAAVFITTASQPWRAPPLQSCTPVERAAIFAQVPDYMPSQTAEFVRLTEGRFTVSSEPYDVRGVNYYPALFPWRRFLTADVDEVGREFALLSDAGFNTLRLFLWHEALFQCEADGAVPEPQGLLKLDALIRLAAEHGFRLILTLHDLPDLDHYRLYDDHAHTRAQTAYLAQRYRDERAILAWDLRNEGDIDYGSQATFGGRFPRDAVLDWLGGTAAIVRDHAPEHLVTAGWLYHAEDTAPYVDFISFHHWWDAADLERRIRELRTRTGLPILLQEVGYSTFERSEAEQARLLGAALDTAERAGLLGWMVWAAFDFPPDVTCFPAPCLSALNAEHFFGLWSADYRPKAAVDAVR